MCNNQLYEPSPEYKLKALMDANLGVGFTPLHLKCFIQLHWDKIKMYAHAIHEDKK